MTNIENLDDFIEKYTKEIKKIAHDENSQENDEPQDLLNEGVKQHIDVSLSILVRLYGEYIKPDTATIKDALEFIPLFAAYGQWIGAQLGVTQETYNAIVDYYLDKFNLLERE